jgi:hypothetical protein
MQILKQSPAYKEKFRLAVNKLLHVCFLLKKKEDTRNDYFFVLQNRATFQEYFDLMGYDLVLHESTGVIAITNQFGSGRLRLKKIETILLLLIRLLYGEKRKELSMTSEVIITTEEIQNKYGTLKITSKPNLDKTTLKDTIRLFRKYNLLQNLTTDVTLSSAQIKLYPSIFFAVSVDEIARLLEESEDRLQRLSSGGDNNDEEMDEESNENPLN